MPSDAEGQMCVGLMRNIKNAALSKELMELISGSWRPNFRIVTCWIVSTFGGTVEITSQGMRVETEIIEIYKALYRCAAAPFGMLGNGTSLLFPVLLTKVANHPECFVEFMLLTWAAFPNPSTLHFLIVPLSKESP